MRPSLTSHLTVVAGSSKRFAMYLDDGVIKHFAISEGPDDPAGDSFPETSCVEAMLEAI